MVDLMPAYDIEFEGTKDWNLLNTYTKEPVFIEGFEMYNATHIL